MQVHGNTRVVSAAFARPADTTAYAANDAVSDSTSAPTALTFERAARVAGGGGYITKARLVTDQSTNVAQFRLWLFSASPTAINDNTAYTYLWADRAILLGSIDLGPLTTEGSGSTAASGLSADGRLAFVASQATQSLFGLLETKTAFTPASAQNFFIELSVEAN